MLPSSPALLSVGRTTATEVEPVIAKTVQIMTASFGFSLHDGRSCVVHCQNWDHSLPPLLLLYALFTGTMRKEARAANKDILLDFGLIHGCACIIGM